MKSFKKSFIYPEPGATEKPEEHVHTISNMTLDTSMTLPPKFLSFFNARKLKIIVSKSNHKNYNQQKGS